MKKVASMLCVFILLAAITANMPLSAAQPTADAFGVDSDAYGAPGSYVIVPVNITNVSNGPITSIRFKVLYNTSILNVTNVTKGELTSGWSPCYNNLEWGTWVIVSTYGGGIPNGSTGSVALLNFSVNESAKLGMTSILNFSDIQLADGGKVGTATPKNGTFYVSEHPPAPFLVQGYVFYENGTACNNPSVNITNTNTSKKWVAETNESSNYYQCMLTAGLDVNAGEILRFDASSPDGTQRKTVLYTVTEQDINNGTLLMNLTLEAFHDVFIKADYTGAYNTGIRIDNATGYSIPPDENLTVGETYFIKYKVENNGTSTETVDITVVVRNESMHWELANYSKDIDNYHLGNVTWDTSSLSPGIYNITVRAYIPNDAYPEDNERNRTVILEAPPTAAPKIISWSPVESVVNDTEGASRTFNITVDQIANVTWFINGTVVFSESGVNESSYTNDSAAVGVWNVSVLVENENGSDMHFWIWNVTAAPPAPAPKIIAYAPPSPVNDTVCTFRTFNITVDQTVNVSWFLNGSFLFKNESVKEASCTLHAEFVGEHNVSAIASNENGSDMHTWTWNVTKAPAPQIISWIPKEDVVSNTEGESRTFSIVADQDVNVTWMINDTVVQTNHSVSANTPANYTAVAVAGMWVVKAIVSNENGSDMHTWTWNVTKAPAPAPEIIAWYPFDSEVNNTEGESRMFAVKANQTVNVTWYINGTVVHENESVPPNTNATYTNESAKAGCWNVSAVVWNENGSDMHSWIWRVKDITPPASVTNLTYTSGYTWINWTWDDPADEDFSHVIVYVDGEFKADVPKGVQHYNATGFGLEEMHTISTRTADIHGNINQTWVNLTASTLPDTTPPVTTVTTSPERPASGWWSGNVSVTFSRYDPSPGTGVNFTRYMMTGANAMPWTEVPGEEDFSVVVSAEGVTTVYFYSVDNASNNESEALGYMPNVTINIDKTPPEIIDVSVDPDVVNVGATINVTVNVSDALSGVHYVTADGTTLTKVGAGTWKGVLTAQSTPGVHNITIVAVDNAGNSITDDTTQYTVAVYVKISGKTGEVNCSLLPFVTVALYKDDEMIKSTTSDENSDYTIEAMLPDFGDYRLMASKEGYLSENISITVTASGEYERDFIAESGLIPEHPSWDYLIECIDHFVQPPTSPCYISFEKLMRVMTAYLQSCYP